MAAKRVLIVDDQHDIRRVLAAGIRTLAEDIDVIDMPSGEEAMLDAARRPVDLLISDVRLPGISGFELIARIRKRSPELKVILITGIEDQKIRMQVANAEVSAFFYKPIHMADFLDAAERCLGLVETAFPMLPVDTPPSNEPPLPTAAELITNMRHEADAHSVLLVDMVGEVVARSGELPPQVDETECISTIVAATGTSKKLAGLLKSSVPDGFWCLQGSAHSLVVAHIGKSHLALVVAKAPVVVDQIRVVARYAQEINLDVPAMSLEEGLEGLTEPIEEITPDAAVILEELPLEALPDLDALFAQKETLQTQDLNAFWDSAADQGGLEGVFSAKTISFDQAFKLGLAPGEEQQKK
jgi:CheY-like chemotaxis protein